MPLKRTEAQEFIKKVHRHNRPPVGDVIRVGLEEDGELIGCAMAGRPVSRVLDNGTTLEVTRVCVLEGYPNANSLLYGAMRRAAKALGYSRMYTYTLQSEGGISLRASGWKQDALLDVRPTWDTPSRRRTQTDEEGDKRPPDPKIRWRIDL